MDLGKYLQQNHNQLTWKKKIQIILYIISSIYNIHIKNVIHRDLHSGNILGIKSGEFWYVSDLGFCGPADKPLKSIYGNLPYIAPEVIAGKEYTLASDIYSIGMLMWEISSGQPPFIGFDHDYDLAMKIINGMRPRIMPETPLEYEKLMKQCWGANPSKRPDIYTLLKEINKMNALYLSEREQQANNDINTRFNENINTSSNFINSLTRRYSQIHIFESLPEPRNATEGKLLKF